MCVLFFHLFMPTKSMSEICPLPPYIHLNLFLVFFFDCPYFLFIIFLHESDRATGAAGREAGDVPPMIDEDSSSISNIRLMSM